MIDNLYFAADRTSMDGSWYDLGDEASEDVLASYDDAVTSLTFHRDMKEKFTSRHRKPRFIDAMLTNRPPEATYLEQKSFPRILTLPLRFFVLKGVFLVACVVVSALIITFQNPVYIVPVFVFFVLEVLDTKNFFVRRGLDDE